VPGVERLVGGSSSSTRFLFVLVFRSLLRAFLRPIVMGLGVEKLCFRIVLRLVRVPGVRVVGTLSPVASKQFV